MRGAGAIRSNNRPGRRGRAGLVAALMSAAATAVFVAPWAHADGWSPPPASEPHSWTGWRAGVHAGVAFSNQDADLDPNTTFLFTDTDVEGDGVANAAGSAGPGGATVTLDAASGAATQDTVVSAQPGAPGNVDLSVLSDSAGDPGIPTESVVNAASTGPEASIFVFNQSAEGDNIATGQAATAGERAGERYIAVATSVAESPDGFALARALAAQNIFDLGSADDLNAADLSLGAHVGYDHQLESGFVVGFEVDLTGAPGGGETLSQRDDVTFTIQAFDENGAPIDGSLETIAVGAARDVELGPTVLASARLRFGYALDSVGVMGREVHLLPYVTGGVGYGLFEGEVTSSLDIDASTFTEAGSFSESVFGGVVGGGLSARLSERTTVSAEGLYYFLDDEIDISDLTINELDDSSVSVNGVFEFRVKLSVDLY